jgi:hypothetical protein
MTAAAELEAGYRRWLRLYPASFRVEHEAEMLTVLLADSRKGQRRPEPSECLDLLRTAAALWLRPRLRTGSAAANAVRLMYIGALVEAATAAIILLTLGSVHWSIIQRQPNYTAAQWNAQMAGTLKPLLIAASAATAAWLILAWANGRDHRWAKPAFALFFTLNLYGLLHGIAHGSATYAPADLAAGTALCLIQLAAVLLACKDDFRKPASRQANPT